MNDLISRLSELRSQYNCFDETEKDAYYTLSEAIEALKEQKIGHWIVTSKFNDCTYAKCDQCNTTQVFYNNKVLINFCQNCGARMECEDKE